LKNVSQRGVDGDDRQLDHVHDLVLVGRISRCQFDCCVS
jgi:hypothetical protein